MDGVAGSPDEAVVMWLVSTLLRCGMAELRADLARAWRRCCCGGGRSAAAAAGLSRRRLVCRRTELVSRSGLQDGSMEESAGRPVGSRRWGSPRGAKGGTFSPVSLVGSSGGSRVRWCQGLGCRGGGSGGGSAVLLGGGRGLVLPGGHGRVGGVVAGVWRSVAVSLGRGENLFYLRMDQRRRSSFPS